MIENLRNSYLLSSTVFLVTDDHVLSVSHLESINHSKSYDLRYTVPTFLSML